MPMQREKHSIVYATANPTCTSRRDAVCDRCEHGNQRNEGKIDRPQYGVTQPEMKEVVVMSIIGTST